MRSWSLRVESAGLSAAAHSSNKRVPRKLFSQRRRPSAGAPLKSRGRQPAVLADRFPKTADHIPRTVSRLLLTFGEVADVDVFETHAPFPAGVELQRNDAFGCYR